MSLPDLEVLTDEIVALTLILCFEQPKKDFVAGDAWNWNLAGPAERELKSDVWQTIHKESASCPFRVKTRGIYIGSIGSISDGGDDRYRHRQGTPAQQVGHIPDSYT